MQTNNFNRVIGAILLTAGTCIGAGMLGFPIYTASGGLIPALVWFGVIYLVMSYTAWLMIQVLFHVSAQGRSGVDLNFLSLAEQTLGRVGRNIVWGLILIFLYCLISAYLTGGINILRLIVPVVLDQLIPIGGWLIIFLSPFIWGLWQGYRVSDYLNRFFLIGLLGSYGLLLMYLLEHVTWHAESVSHWSNSLSAWPILVTAFGYHLLIPSLKNYLDPAQLNQPKTQRQMLFVVLCGGLLSLCIYVVWECLIFKIIPGSELIKISASGSLELFTTTLIARAPQVQWLILGFSFFALVSSCLGVTIGLYDFFADGLQLDKTNFKQKHYLLALTFLPPSLFTMVFPNGFLYALKYAGVFAVLLLIIFPALMMGSIRRRFSWDLGCVILFGSLAIAQIFR